MADNSPLPLQQLIASLDNTCLPKILQVCSGVYFQGSVYELSGSEVCFSTGDLIKVIGLDLKSVCCEDISSNERFELPINHTGLFKVVPEEMPYSTVKEMITLRPVGLENCLPFTFTCRSKMTFDNFTLRPGRALTVLSIERHEGKEDEVRCHVQGPQDAFVEVCIPLSSQGEFYECESEECFTLQEIMSSVCLRSRRFRFINTTKYGRPLILSPVHEVHAVMDLRKDILKFPSSLEVDVVDVTELCKDVHFVTPLSLTEVLSQPDESFPLVVEIVEGPETRSLFKCSWVPQLLKKQHLVFHKKGTSAMMLISSTKSRKTPQYFLVSQQYNGRFRRRPREFTSVYELYVASKQTPGLTVNVTRNCEEVEEECLPALSVGEQLKVVCCHMLQLPCRSSEGERQSVEALWCQRLQEPDDGDDDDDDDDDKVEAKQEEQHEDISLPLYMQGHFVQFQTDSKKYKLENLGKEFHLPLDVKLVNRDTELETDPLAGCLRIEGAMVEPTIQASFLHSPEHCFEIPTQWLSMSVSLNTEPPPWPSDHTPKCHVERVTEVTDTFFYEFRKRDNSDAAAPPLPPKRNLSNLEPQKKSSKPRRKSSTAKKSNHQPDDPTKQLANLTLRSKKRPPAPPAPVISDDQPPPLAPRNHSAAALTTVKAPPNTYVKIKETTRKAPLCQVAADETSDHDYEQLDETLMTVLSNAQANVMFY